MMKQYDVYLADLNPTIGREQFGKRPVLIISNNYENLLDVITIIPITSLKEGRRIYPNEVLLKDELEVPLILYQTPKQLRHHIFIPILYNIIITTKLFNLCGICHPIA